MSLKSDQLQFLCQYFINEKSPREFEEWLYENSNLDQGLNEIDYLDLISLNYSRPLAEYESKKILNAHLPPNVYIKYVLCQMMKDIIERSENVHWQISETYNLYCKGYDFFQKMGFTYGLRVDCPPPEYMSGGRLSSDQLEKLLNSFYPDIIGDAQQILSCLNENKIEFKLSESTWLVDGLPDYPEYNDHRNKKEKRTMGLKGINLRNPIVRFLWQKFKIPIYSYDP